MTQRFTATLKKNSLCIRRLKSKKGKKRRKKSPAGGFAGMLEAYG